MTRIAILLLSLNAWGAGRLTCRDRLGEEISCEGIELFPGRRWRVQPPVDNKATAHGPYPVEWSFDIDKPIRLKLKCEWVVEAK